MLGPLGIRRFPPSSGRFGPVRRALWPASLLQGLGDERRCRAGQARVCPKAAITVSNRAKKSVPQTAAVFLRGRRRLARAGGVGGAVRTARAAKGESLGGLGATPGLSGWRARSVLRAAMTCLAW